MSLQPGDTIEGKYRIVRVLGEGGMGSVYEGENIRIHRKVAIKVLHAAVALKADAVQRFEREAQAAGRIGSEHIVEVLDLGNLATGERFMVMEFLEGESLGDRIKRKQRLGPYEVAHILHQLLDGLAAAHAAGIIHRDLKPDNVFLLSSKGGVRDFVKILDFGVSKFTAAESELSMTKTGAVMGTPFYMSPEQARGGKVDFRTDLYSAGVVTYQAVTGRVPFSAETFNELVFKIALESPEPAEMVAPGIDPTFASIITRSMFRDPGARYQSAREFQAAIDSWLISATPDPTYELGRVSSAMGILRMSSSALPGVSSGSLPRIVPPAPTSSPMHTPISSRPAVIGEALGRSGLGQSGLGQSGLGQSGLGQGSLNRSGLGQSSLTRSGAHGSFGDLELPSRPPPRKGGGTAVAVVIVGILAMVGGGFGAYRALAVKPPAPISTAAQPATRTAVPLEKSMTPPEPTTPPVVESALPSVAGTAAPELPSSATPELPAAQPPPRPGRPWPRGKAGAGAPPATATAQATPPPPPTGGRVISNEL